MLNKQDVNYWGEEERISITTEEAPETMHETELGEDSDWNQLFDRLSSQKASTSSSEVVEATPKRRLSRSSFHCVLCDLHFHKKSQLRAHIIEEHQAESQSDDSASCCSDSAQSQNSFEPVTLDEEREKELDCFLVSCTVYKCPHKACSKEFTTEGKLDKHLKKHEEKRHMCGFPLCGKQFSFRHELLEHVKEEHAPKQTICTICEKEFKDLQSLQLHLRTIHKTENKVFRCHFDGCNKCYTNKRNLDDHIKTTHLKTKQFKCDICQRVLKHKASLRRHYKNIHKQEYVEPASTPTPVDGTNFVESAFTDVSNSKQEEAFFETEASNTKKRSIAKTKKGSSSVTTSERSKKKVKVGDVYLDRILGADI